MSLRLTANTAEIESNPSTVYNRSSYLRPQLRVRTTNLYSGQKETSAVTAIDSGKQWPSLVELEFLTPKPMDPRDVDRELNESPMADSRIEDMVYGEHKMEVPSITESNCSGESSPQAENKREWERTGSLLTLHRHSLPFNRGESKT